MSMGVLYEGLYFLFFVLFLSVALMLVSMILGQRVRRNSDKLVSFECGFDPMSSSRSPFSFRFFVLALLFLIFDVEVVMIISFCYSLKLLFFSLSSVSSFYFFLFFLILLLGLVHEANEGSLDW
uniref:NADH dehydrogenase subunit 3 n=1 Tax=Mactra quadrangularis TaxID=120570 RepID=UPI001BEF22F2|nr:NADH dehydrogenase subunit 3 [Mactra quadrangularis]QUV72906.1 NADH dehydrogenase subunit 3 [Mactra quadrangularis]